jgi:molecular chaperone GrpE
MKIHPENPDEQSQVDRGINPENVEPQAESGSVEDPSTTDEPTTIESLKKELVEAEKRILLAQADLENFRRRNRRDMQDQLKYASLDLMSELLDSLDNLQRAIESYEQEPNGEGLFDGVKMVAQQIQTTLENHGCQRIEAVGQPFDPALHQAVQMQPSDEFAANMVMMDMRPGFRLHERVIRPSQVFVSKGPTN